MTILDKGLKKIDIILNIDYSSIHKIIYHCLILSFENDTLLIVGKRAVRIINE